MMIGKLGVLGVFGLLCAGGARADIIDASATGLGSPAQTITFDEHQFPTNTVITNQYADLGVTFSPNVYYSPQTGFPNIQGNDVGDFTFPTQPASVNPVTMSFSNTQHSVAFAMAADNTPYTFDALLNGTVVDSFTTTVGASSNDFYGFTSDTFNSISITQDGEGGGPYWLLDNLQTGPSVPPETFGGSTNTGLMVSNPADGFTPNCFGDSCGDPIIKINLGGMSPCLNTGNFTLSANAAGNITHGDLINCTGQTINDILIQTTLDPVQLQTGYTCLTTAFGECGFRLDPTVPNTLDMLFDDAGIPTGTEFTISGTGWVLSTTSTPEPGSWALLLTVAAGLIVRQRVAGRSRSCHGSRL